MYALKKRNTLYIMYIWVEHVYSYGFQQLWLLLAFELFGQRDSTLWLSEKLKIETCNCDQLARRP